MYWIYRTRIFGWRNQPVQAVLIDASTGKNIRSPATDSFHSPHQLDSYGSDLDLTFRINAKHPHPDNYFNSIGFQIYSERLINLFFSFDVKAEVFPVRMVDRAGKELPSLKYFIFHSLEGVLPAMDEEKSTWTGDRNVGIPQLVLDLDRFPHRPIFLCNHIYVPLIRDDVKQAIQRERIIGFDFLKPENYHSGEFGIATQYEE